MNSPPSPPASQTLTTNQGGRVVAARRLDSQGKQVGGVSYEYDAQGRLSREIDARNGASVTTYTAADQVDVIITERAVFRREKGQAFVLTETADGYTVEDIAACTDMTYEVADDVKLGAYAKAPAPAH